MSEPSQASYPSALTSATALGGSPANQRTYTVSGAHASDATIITTTATISAITAPNYLVCGRTGEVIYFEAISGVQFTTCTRGADSTTAAALVDGDVLYHIFVANTLNQLHRELIAVETELGAAPKTIDDTVAPGASPASVAAYLDMLANIVKTMRAVSNWYSAAASIFSDAEGDPANLGAVADGTSTYTARRDHVHSAQVTAKGDILAATAASTLTNLAVGTDGQVLKADSAQASGLAWGAAAGGGKTRLTLSPAAGHPPDDTTGSAAAGIQMKVTSAAADPQVRWCELLFDATTDEHWYWQFAMPSNYGSAPVVDVYYKMTSAVAGDVIFGASIMAVTDGDAQDVDADAFATTNTSAATTVPASAGYMDVCSITLTNADSVAANDFVVLGVYRDADNAGDTATGDAEVVMVVLRYTGA